MSICVHLWFTLRDGIPIRPIIVEIEIEIEIGIGIEIGIEIEGARDSA